MTKLPKKFIFPIIISLILLGVGGFIFNTNNQKDNLKLYWFIPDGMRAEPSLFTVYKWADEGKLPNIKKLMERGSYGYSYPNFPSHTPTNFAALLTGSYPEVNGIDDGPMRAIGKPLDAVAVPGFRSTARKVPAIWKTLEDVGMKVAILSVPGSTPPEIDKGVVIRGRWGGWGADFYGLNFEQQGDLTQRVSQGRASRFFYFGPQLTNYIADAKPNGWKDVPNSFSDPYEITMNGWGTNVYGYVYDSTDDGKANYDHVVISLDKKDIVADISESQWSDWSDITLKWTSAGSTVDIPTNFRVNVIKLGDSKFFRMRILYNNLNETIAYPSGVATKLMSQIGPMVDFVDNFPAQLIYYPEDKTTFMQELDMSFAWHTKAVGAVVKDFSPNVVIQDIYSPNQMLTSRWWMGSVDPKSTQYDSVSPSDRDQLWSEVKDMYVKLDNIIGEVIKNSGPNTYIVLSSDHGAVPLNRYVNLNNLFAQKGWLKFTIDSKTGEPIIDWENSKVIYLKMAHVYINPNGLDGNYDRDSGPAYEKLRNEVIGTLQNLQDSDGTKPLVDIVKWEDAKEFMQLDTERIGDLVIANAPGYGWNEEMSRDMKIFNNPLVSGYKQAIEAKDIQGMWTPFIISGPGIKKNNYLGDTPFSLVNQYPTIMKALKVAIPNFVQGTSLPVFTDGR
jgi:predicted AlkP superfamily phosphohydrolase/phosphomutase